MAEPLPLLHLTDGTVRLRPPTPADVGAVAHGFAEPTVLRWSWPHRRPYTVADAEQFVADAEGSRRAGHEVNLVVEVVDPHGPAGGAGLAGAGAGAGGAGADGADGAGPGPVLGMVAVHAFDAGAARADLGYWLIGAARGRGLATRAVTLLAEWAFADLHLHRLQITCDPANTASQRVALRCGFRREGILRGQLPFRGGFRDTMVFGRLHDDPDGR